MRISYLTAIAIFIVLLSLAPQNPNKSADFEIDTKKIKEWGMSESAWRDMHVVASILTGGTLLEFRKDETSGIYWPSYSSTTPTNPNADPAIKSEGAREEREKNLAAIINRLRVFADADETGFISSKEAIDFRELVEFGYKISFIAAQEKRNMEQICRGLGMTSERVRQRLAEYRKLVANAELVGVKAFPQVDL